MNEHIGQSVAEVYQDFILAKTAEGVSDITIRNYHQHLHNISKYLEVVSRVMRKIVYGSGRNVLQEAAYRNLFPEHHFIC